MTNPSRESCTFTPESVREGGVSAEELLTFARNYEQRIPDEADNLAVTRNVARKIVAICRELAALKQAREGATPSAWQPIETAPKDRKVLVAYKNRLGNWRIVTARNYSENTLENEESFSWDSGEEYAPAGWYEETENAEQIGFTDEPPSHWMPLPEPPK